MKANEISASAAKLKTYWTPREREFREHYRLITMVDELRQKGMESFVGNDPRTFYQRALQLLTSTAITHRVPLEGLTDVEIIATTEVERFLDYTWKDINRKYRLRGRSPWIKELVSFLLITGWYAATALYNIDTGELVTDVWNPAEVFPEYGDDGLIKCAHIYERSASQAQAMCRANDWKPPTLKIGNIKVTDYWEMTSDGPANAVVMGVDLVKPLTPLEVPRIPVLVAPVAGIPDRGSISLNPEDWKAHLGEGILASNKEVYKAFNRLTTYGLQLTRDTATPRWKERTKGEPIIPVDDPEAMNRRGVILRMGLDEDVGPVEVPPIPVELQALLFNMQNQIQRGSFSWAMYGNVEREISGYLNAQIVAAGTGVLAPYHEAIMFVVSEVDNVWLDFASQNLAGGFQIPVNYPVGRRIEAQYELAIPSDLIQRAAVARQLLPAGTPVMSQTTVQDKVLGVKNPIEEQARIMKDLAMMHPVAVQLS